MNMSFPDIRAALDDKAGVLWRAQVLATPIGEHVRVDLAPLTAAALEIIERMSDGDRVAALAKHMVEHAGKATREKSSAAGRDAIHRIDAGAIPFEFDIGDLTYTRGSRYYPLRHLTYVLYIDDLSHRRDSTRREYDDVETAWDKRHLLADIWGSRTLGEVVTDPNSTPPGDPSLF